MVDPTTFNIYTGQFNSFTGTPSILFIDGEPPSLAYSKSGDETNISDVVVGAVVILPLNPPISGIKQISSILCRRE